MAIPNLYRLKFLYMSLRWIKFIATLRCHWLYLKWSMSEQSSCFRCYQWSFTLLPLHDPANVPPSHNSNNCDNNQTRPHYRRQEYRRQVVNHMLILKTSSQLKSHILGPGQNFQALKTFEFSNLYTIFINRGSVSMLGILKFVFQISYGFGQYVKTYRNLEIFSFII